MKARLALVVVAALAAASCSPQKPSVEATPGAAPKVRAHANATPIRGAQLQTRFASMPDRGSLVRYPGTRTVRKDGAYTWHRADFSESHARAAIGGVLAFTSPSGKLLRFRYERHVDHPNGDWTWVGSLGSGALQEAVITFGSKAAFGSIGQPGEEALRLTIRNGTSWLVETDLAQIAKLDHVGTRPTAPDYLIAPEPPGASRPRLSAVASSTLDMPRASGLVAATAGAVAPTTVDLVLGYTSGFASRWGGDSQAQTRLNNMVEITNETYSNSQIDARIRLVRAVAVSYPDTTTNEDALEELTGYRDGSTITPNPAFNALRAARDQYGGDLVSLVRKFSAGNEGCGIAWLIGGGRRGTISSSSERFGYSIVGDDEYSADGKTYFCRQETLAHELGHNMGAQHDRDTADGDDNALQDNEYGVYDYSFGHKTGSTTGNFFTVMAYGDPGQVRNRIFSNPRIAKCGAESNTHPRGFGPSTPIGTLACGTATADNARTLLQTMPMIATFRATVVVDPSPVASRADDVNGDGKSDLVWRNEASGQLETWAMNGAVLTTAQGFTLPAGYRVMSRGDFNGDRKLDLLLYGGSRDLVMWFGTGIGFNAQALGRSFGLGWMATELDANGDGVSDLLWRNDTTGQFETWMMSGANLTSAQGFQLQGGFKILTSGDFNGDRKADLVLANAARELIMWFGTGTSFNGQAMGRVYTPGWRVSGDSDVNGDGKSDLVWRNDGTSQFETWVMDATTLVAARGYQLGAGYRLIGQGDYNGDGLADVLLSGVNRDQVIWFGSGTSFNGQSLNRTYGMGWQSGPQMGYGVGRAAHDFNGDGVSDLLWQADVSERFEIWSMESTVLRSASEYVLASGSRILAIGDFDGDNRSDLLIGSAARELTMWVNAGNAFSSVPLNRVYGSGWAVSSGTDLNADGKSDLIWRDAATGQFETWIMDGPRLHAARGFQLGGGYRITTTGDFNSDGMGDLLLANAARDLIMWFGNGAAFNGQSVGRTYGVGWLPASLLDFNGDARSDLLWRSEGTGQFEAWMMNGVTLSSARGYQLPAGYRVIGSGDFNGDMRTDLFLSGSSRDQVMWFSNGDGSFSGVSLNRTYGAGWSLNNSF